MLDANHSHFVTSEGNLIKQNKNPINIMLLKDLSSTLSSSLLNFPITLNFVKKVCWKKWRKKTHFVLAGVERSSRVSHPLQSWHILRTVPVFTMGYEKSSPDLYLPLILYYLVNHRYRSRERGTKNRPQKPLIWASRRYKSIVGFHDSVNCFSWGPVIPFIAVSVDGCRSNLPFALWRD